MSKPRTFPAKQFAPDNNNSNTGSTSPKLLRIDAERQLQEGRNGLALFAEHLLAPHDHVHLGIANAPARQSSRETPVKKCNTKGPRSKSEIDSKATALRTKISPKKKGKQRKAH
jgi:hypothetical protein